MGDTPPGSSRGFCPGGDALKNKLAWTQLCGAALMAAMAFPLMRRAPARLFTVFYEQRHALPPRPGDRGGGGLMRPGRSIPLLRADQDLIIIVCFRYC